MIRYALALLLALATFGSAHAAPDPALGGYDPVSLTGGERPQKGIATNWVEWNGATWYFASAANKAKFNASPEKYAPQYNGYCPVSLMQGKPEAGDVAQMKEVNGKIYVMSSPEAKTMFERDPFKVIDFADPNWNKLREGLSQ